MLSNYRTFSCPTTSIHEVVCNCNLHFSDDGVVLLDNQDVLTVQVATTLHLLCLIAYGKLCKVSNGSLIVTVLTLDTVKKERK